MANDLTPPINTDTTAQALRQTVRRDLVERQPADAGHEEPDDTHLKEAGPTSSPTSPRGQNLDIIV